MRIRLIEPRPPGHHVYDRALLPRLGLPLMGALLAERYGHDVRCYCEVLAPIDVEDCLSADLIGISSTTSTVPYAYQLAADFEAAGIPVVMGGPHVTFQADEALAYARYVVRGEGQATICELVEALERSAPLAGIRGLSWRDQHGQFHHTPDRPRCSQREFEDLPIPDLSLIAGYERMPVMPLMTQWGCPFDCDFCSVTAMFSRSVRYRRTDQVLAELSLLDADRVFFHDDIFVANKHRTSDLLRGMVDADLTPGWAAQVRAADTVFASKRTREPDRQFLKLMRDSGCQMVMVGFESVSDASLKALNKRQEVRDIVDSVDLFHAHGIKVHGLFMAGIDTDSAGQAEETVRFAKRHNIDTIQIMIETPIPGSHLYRRALAEGRIVTADWSVFDGHHAVIRPAGAHPYDVQMQALRAMRHFYSLPHIAAPAVRQFLRQAPELVRASLRNRLPAKLPALASLALRHHWQELTSLLKERLPEADRRLFEDAFSVPALRLYGRRQLHKWQLQEHSLAHLRFLAGLP